VTIYSVADGYLTTTLGEGWGLGIIEALACGLPVAVPDHTGCGEIAQRVAELGMPDRIILLPTEDHYVALPSDNCRLRRRVDVDLACDALVKRPRHRTIFNRSGRGFCILAERVAGG
jgi:glycosyltransferase involved in cell wall biosynthesis